MFLDCRVRCCASAAGDRRAGQAGPVRASRPRLADDGSQHFSSPGAELRREVLSSRVNRQAITVARRTAGEQNANSLHRVFSVTWRWAAFVCDVRRLRISRARQPASAGSVSTNSCSPARDSSGPGAPANEPGGRGRRAHRRSGVSGRAIGWRLDLLRFFSCGAFQVDAIRSPPRVERGRGRGCPVGQLGQAFCELGCLGLLSEGEHHGLVGQRCPGGQLSQALVGPDAGPAPPASASS